VDKKLINVNLLGTICLTKAILPHFLQRKTGHFVVITSLTGKFGTQLRSSYAAAKARLAWVLSTRFVQKFGGKTCRSHWFAQASSVPMSA
jgi:NADP-dependent 3-hydroxy acid dehydrogenase YdfG